MVVAEKISSFALEQRIPQLKELAEENFIFVASHQHPSGRFEASLGRAEKKYAGKTWPGRDQVGTVKFASNLFVRKYLPELFDPEFAKENNLPKTADQVYKDGMDSALKLYSSPEQLRRLETRPCSPFGDGYYEMNDQLTPAVKFYTSSGRVFRVWGHNQPDALGSLIGEYANGIQMGLLDLDKLGSRLPFTGFVLQKIAAYLANAHVERLRCKSMWEHEDCWAPRSTRTAVFFGLREFIEVFPDIQSNSQVKGYKLSISKGELEDGLGQLGEKRAEFGLADWTERRNHLYPEDLASAIVASDTPSGPAEKEEILKTVLILENRKGVHRFRGDGYKIGLGELKFVIGKAVIAQLFAELGINRYRSGDTVEGFSDIDHALDRIDDLMAIYEECGHFPELYSNDNPEGIYLPNNNDLGWTRGKLNEALGTTIAAISIAGQSYHQAA